MELIIKEFIASRSSYFVKVFSALLLLNLGAMGALAGTFYGILKKNKESEYIDLYRNVGSVLANSFAQMELMAQRINDNAARVAFELERREGVLEAQAWLKLSHELGVASIDVIDHHGRFLRSPVVPMELQTNSLFDYCPKYRDLVEGKSKYQTTPIIPGHPHGTPCKFTMISNHDGNLRCTPNLGQGFKR